jgi:hypothetical protein
MARKTFDNRGLGMDADPAGFQSFNPTGYQGSPLYVASADANKGNQTIPTYAKVNGIMTVVGSLFNAEAQEQPEIAPLMKTAMPTAAPPALSLPGVNLNIPETQVSFSLASLLQPPYVYMLVGAGIVAAWYYSEKR